MGFVGGVITLMRPRGGLVVVVVGPGDLGGGLPRDEGVWGLGTRTLSGPVALTDRFVATSGGECAASERLSESREMPPSDSRVVSEIQGLPSGNGGGGCAPGWCASSVSCGYSRGGGRPIGSGNLKIEKRPGKSWFDVPGRTRSQTRS